MSETVIKQVKLFDLTAGGQRLYRLRYPNLYLVPVDVTADEEIATFQYDTNELKSVSDIQKADRSEKLRLLVNAASLFELCGEYNFTLNPENLMMDRNLEPRIIMRDLRGEDSNHDFLEEYKALAGCILVPRYSFQDYLEGGQGLYKKKKILRTISQAKSTEELRARILDQYEQEMDHLKKHKKLVDRRRYLTMQIALPVLSILILTAGAGLWYLVYQVFPFQKALLDADHFFLREDYDGTINALEEYAPMKLPKEELYRLSQAYVISESLSQAQKRNILSGLTVQTDNNLLVYWIQLGRLEYDAAIDTAMRIGDDELLLYALLKQEASIQTNNAISGEEKSAELASISKQITELQSKLEEKETAVEASSGVAS